MEYTTNLLHEYKSIDNICRTSKRDVSDVLLAAILGGVPVYFVNQSQKILTYIPMKYNSNTIFSIKGLKAFFRVGGVLDSVEKGQLIEIESIRALDYLLKEILTERDLFFIRSGGDYYLEGRMGVLTPRLGWWSPNFALNIFHKVTLQHTYIKVDDFSLLVEQLNRMSKSSKEAKEDSKPSKQQQREVVFIKWLQVQDEQQVPYMKKRDVWAELQKLEHVLFSVEPKNFFRDQKIITFKSGRKPN